MRKRIIRTDHYQKKRITENPMSNGKLPPALIRKYCVLTKGAKDFINRTWHIYQLSGRAYDKVLKVSRTIADLEQKEIIDEKHIAEALQYRSFYVKQYLN